MVFAAATQLACAVDAETYFPVSAQGSSKTVSEFEEEWYSKHLRIMGQPTLFAERGDKSKSVYRFTLLPTWSEPQCVVVTARGDKSDICFVRLDGAGGYDPGKLVEQARRDLSPEEVKRFLELFEMLDFRRMPTADPVAGLDGSQWILESLREGEYHVVVRWTADAYDPEKRGTASFVELCRWMLSSAPRSKSPEPPP